MKECPKKDAADLQILYSYTHGVAANVDLLCHLFCIVCEDLHVLKAGPDLAASVQRASFSDVYIKHHMSNTPTDTGGLSKWSAARITHIFLLTHNSFIT